MSRPPHLRTAAELLDALGITNAREIDVEAIAQYCGATILYEPLQGCEARILGYGDRAVITINPAAAAALVQAGRLSEAGTSGDSGRL